jgi:hypothetical protein
MLNENAKKWVAALRSGRFSQGRGCLSRDGDHCCLGVAYRVYAEENEHVPFTESVNTSMGSTFTQGEESTCTTLLLSIMNWLGLRTPTGQYNDPRLSSDKKSYNWSLTCENDEACTSFNKIADIIESEPEGLFVEKETKSC